MFWIPGTFFPKMGLPIQSQEIRSQEIKSAVENKSEEKKNPKKSPKCWENEVKSKSLKKKKNFIHLYFEYSHGFFKNQLTLFCMVVNILCSHAFSYIIGLFSRGRFCMQLY